MKIACLGWGSLIWRPENLLLRSGWFMDGPLLPIEYARQSKDGRLTLVITEKAKPVRTLWATMATSELALEEISLARTTFENTPCPVILNTENRELSVSPMLIPKRIRIFIWL